MPSETSVISNEPSCLTLSYSQTRGIAFACRLELKLNAVEGDRAGGRDASGYGSSLTEGDYDGVEILVANLELLLRHVKAVFIALLGAQDIAPRRNTFDAEFPLGSGTGREFVSSTCRSRERRDRHTHGSRVCRREQ